MLGVEQLSRPREPQGAVTRVEDATDTGKLFGLAVALEDTNWLQNDDKRRAAEFVRKAAKRIELSRLPACSWYEVGCKLRRRALQRDIQGRNP